MSLRRRLELKTPDEIKDYGVDWDIYLATGVTITASSWVVPTGITKNSDGIDGRATVVRLSGGASGTAYALTNRITTSTGETLEAAIEVCVRSAAAIAGI